MRENKDGTLSWGVESIRRYKVMEMHLFDEELCHEEDLCGAGTSGIFQRSVGGYLKTGCMDTGWGPSARSVKCWPNRSQ